MPKQNIQRYSFEDGIRLEIINTPDIDEEEELDDNENNEQELSYV